MIGSDSSTPHNVLQEYLSLLHDATYSHDTQTRDIRLLRAWGVIRYILYGPMNCEHCQAQVRLAIPITSERFSGEILQYACLCTNCTFKELALSHRITMQVGSARVEYPHEDSLSK
jgi:hypothetical protein